MIRSGLCDYRNVYIHVKGTITVWHTATAGAVANNANKKQNIGKGNIKNYVLPLLNS